jgi:tripartite-type tricarboxylate transporter receptor subunit TctC
MVRSGRIKALAVTGPRRSSSYPELPTLIEQGVAFDTAVWYGLFAPARTPAPIVEQLARAIDTVLQQAETGEKVRALGMEPDPISREGFAQQIQRDLATWARLVRVGNIRAD